MTAASDKRLSATLALDAPVGKVRAVSGARATALGALGIRTVRDLLTHFPRRYVDMSQLATIAGAVLGESCTIVASVHEVKLKRPRPRMNLTEITLVDATGTLIVTCFRQPWLADKLRPGDRIAVSGKLEFNYGFRRMTNPYLEQLDSAEAPASGLVVAVHPASEKVTTSWMRRFIANALELVRGMDDPLPLDLRVRYRLPGKGAALRAIHFPRTMDEAAAARRRLAYEEVLLLELHLMSRAAERVEHLAAIQHVTDGQAVAAFGAALPFELSAEQRAAADDLLRAMAKPQVARHMLLGDVGTGKTVVAGFGLAAAADSGKQALMMAPTEVLAEQHATSLGPLLDAAGVSWGLLTGSTAAEERAGLIARLADGGLQVLFGTHALLEDDVAPRACSLVVIDEQQRFGVEQRAALVRKGPGADLLSMTATPIPRTLALALYGDLTLSYIKQRPRQRAPIATSVFAYTQQGAAYEAATDALARGEQVYVVCPLVQGARGGARAGDGETAGGGARAKAGAARDGEDAYEFDAIVVQGDGGDWDEHVPVRAAVDHASYLQSTVFPGYEVGVLHGRLKSDEKRQVMADFREGIVQVLVSTTVIEVGVDVPNATVMIVEDADRFGLAQLHQLRGRVGRGDAPGHVCLISGSKSPVALARLQAMERTQDGFELAEYDLSLRREGDILGNRQHGAGSLKLVNVMRDAKMIEAAHSDARALLDADPQLSAPEHAALRHELSRAFERVEPAG